MSNPRRKPPLKRLLLVVPLLPCVLCLLKPRYFTAEYLNVLISGPEVYYSECRSNLRALWVAQRSYFHEKNQYRLELYEVGFSPGRGNRYAYFVGPGPMEERSTREEPRAVRGRQAIGVDTAYRRFLRPKPLTWSDLPKEVAEQVGLFGECPSCEVTMACLAQLDDDPTLDVWTISTAERIIQGRQVPAGESFHHVDDFEL